MSVFSAERLPDCNHYILRLHLNDNATLGDDYTWCCTIVDEGNGVARITAVIGKLPISAAHKLKVKLKEVGFKRRYYERREGGIIRLVHEKEL